MSNKKENHENETEGLQAQRRQPARSDAQRLQEESQNIIEDIIHQYMANRLRTLRPEDIIKPKPKAETRKGRTRPSSGWVHAPAFLELLAAAEKRLVRCAAEMGMIVHEVKRVHARLIKGTKLVVIQPADENDQTAYEVHRYEGNSGAWVNLFTLLAPENLTIETGYKERFDIAYVPKGSLLYPGLVFDMDLPRERRRTKRDHPAKAARRRKEAEAAEAPQKAEAAAAAEGAGPAQGSPEAGKAREVKENKQAPERKQHRQSTKSEPEQSAE